MMITACSINTKEMLSAAKHDNLAHDDDHSIVINTGHLNEPFLAVLQP